ncbi:Predicted arabinose efflux permease, MFS family [Jatrophihabitans endophyticus]|uniref:Predicted arabinose efflux permease, MFS family n=1 Tax=Jatrophihabitans endophyticus TaxID=1206085 RepID=A0A1M5P964_9ACTN|nr:MFS transporter [Jatrophihabitans endophyticus]SHG98354.1 Predicted arabinose efflux permease, MFS family [Jatrophihabitans endophyticus]
MTDALDASDASDASDAPDAATTRPAPDDAPNLRVLGAVLAAACGLTVANLYYAQPLLDLIAGSFGVGQGTATAVVTLTQVGYVLGLLFVVPVGDLVENRTLVVRTLVGTALSLVLAAASPVFGVFLAVAVLVGVTSVVAQLLVPLAAHLAPEAERGRFVGRVMSGLLLGILLARTAASLLAEAWSWRAVYVVSAVLTVGLGVLLHRILPTRRPDHRAGYGSLLASVAGIAREEPVLRRLALSQACMFGAFSAFWTAIAYELIDEHGFGQGAIGVFALVGAAGAAAAPLGGWLADHGHGRAGRLVALLLAAAAMTVAGLGHGSVVLLAVAGVLLDLAVQCHQVMSQHVIYALRPDARSRVTTVYMSTVFVGGAISSAAAGLLHDTAGWGGVAAYGAVLPLAGALLWLTGKTTASR